MQNLIFVTDFGDAGLIVPFCTTIAVTLLLLGGRAFARAWLLTTLVVWGLLLLLKLTGYAASSFAPASLLGEIGLITPSGHVAGAAMTYGGLAGLFAARRRRRMAAAGLVAAGLAVVIGATRVWLGEHTVSEVVVGGAVGLSGAIGMAALAPAPLSGRSGAVLVAVAALALVLLHGTHMTWEPMIRTFAHGAVRQL